MGEMLINVQSKSLSLSVKTTRNDLAQNYLGNVEQALGSLLN